MLVIFFFIILKIQDIFLYKEMYLEYLDLCP